MAANDLTFVPGEVIPEDTTLVGDGILDTGVTAVAGDLLVVVATKFQLADNSTGVQSNVTHIACSGGSQGQSISVGQPGGVYDLGASVTNAAVGMNLTASDVGGKFGRESDRVTGEFLTTVGSMLDASRFRFQVFAYQVAKP